MNEENLNFIKEKFKGNVDVKYRVVECENGTINMIFIDNLCDSKFISEYIVAPILLNKNHIKGISDLKNNSLFAFSIGDVKDRTDAALHILSGDVVIVADFFEKMMFCEAKGFVRRSVGIPITEGVIKGPREGFTEAFVDNISLIRRKIKNENLKFESVYLGEKSQTVVVVAYLKGIAPERLVNIVKSKVKQINVEYLLESNYIEDKLKNKKTVFDTVGYSEKADVVANEILSGKVGVIVDGTPFVVTAPYFFYENFQAADDYYLNKYFVNFSRIVRWIAFFIAMFAPALYIAITTYNFAVIPSTFIFRLSLSRAGIPFPTVIELYIMMFSFQVLREAGIRLPQPVGQAIGIIGGLILGESAVGAGLASEITIIIVALSSISSFLVPKLYGAIAIWSPIMVLFAAFCGLPGFYIGVCVLIAHLGSLKSIDYPYIFPIGTPRRVKSNDEILRGDLDNIYGDSLKGGDGK
ncbi:spore germination protein [Clostridium hydrogenum]|uniref:spore germination protein n=1 Tax=Clostridium hydrogenum TaxID=2855764 RepID=UPI001F2103B0|nr:spore germination protein [Clostridium hydrogenum]